MSGSWIKNGRRRLKAGLRDLQETWRMMHHRIQCDSFRLGVDATPVDYRFDVQAQVFGGQLASFTAPVKCIETALPCVTGTMEGVLHARVAPGPTLVIAPPITLVPAITSPPDGASRVALLPTAAKPKGLPIPVLQPPALVPVQPHQWKVRPIAPPRRLFAENFSKVRILQTPAMARTMARRMPMSQQLSPIERKPIPPHRFPREKRERFRTALAQAVSLPEADVSIVSVYDRMYLGLFQSLSQGDDGTLICKPKLPSELDRRTTDLPPVYLVIGKSAKLPGRNFRAVIPMTEFSV